MPKLSINIDMGAKNNGVFAVELQDGKILSKSAFNVTFDGSDINFDKSGRTAQRHTMRGNNRKTMLNRLCDEIFAEYNFSQNEKEAIYGLTKNRGFAFMNIEFDDKINDEILAKLAEIDGYEFTNCKVLADFEREINDKISSLDTSEALKFLDNQAKILSKLLPKPQNGKTPRKDNFQQIVAKIISIFTATRTEIYKNAKHRSKYFDDIKSEISLNLVAKTKFSETEFHHIICNLSNLQTRVLRRYFNEKFDTKFNDVKLLTKIRQNALNLHYKSDSEKANFKVLNQAFATRATALDFLAHTDPLATIPPFEDRNNIKPLKCETLVLNDEILTPTMDKILEKILKNENFSDLTIDKNGEILSDYENFTDDQKLTYLHRFLDVSKAFLNDSDFYPRNLDKNKELFCREIGLGQDEFKEIKSLCDNYYKEITEAKKGIMLDKILRPCGLHTPYKNNCKHEHLSAIFGTEISPNEARELENFILDKNHKISRQTIKGFLSDLCEIKSELSNKFYYALKDENHPEFKNVEKFVKNYGEVINALKQNFSFLEFKEPTSQNLSFNFNTLSQLGDIVLDDSKGFNKTCTAHTIENRLRSSGETPFASRLTANSARALINGKVDMLLNRTAYEIAKKIKQTHTGLNEIIINVERNKFSFEESARDLLKGKEKVKKIKVQNFICPYSGSDKLTLKNCEFDHIVARHHGGFSETLNGEANLIPCDPSANLLKSNKKLTLDDLNEKYLNNIYKISGVKNMAEFRNFIAQNMPNEQAYTNFKNLSTHGQIALRHALFLSDSDESFKTALKILRGEKNKTVTNGTQKRFINLLSDKLKDIYGKGAILEANLIDSKEVSAKRIEFSSLHEAPAKEKIQDKHSHCVDAMVIFALSRDGENANFKDEIYLNESEIITPMAKKFLELKPHQISSKPLFDKGIYSLEFDSSNLKKSEFEILRDLGALEVKIKGKKELVRNDENLDENGKYFIKSSTVFAKYFELFETKNIAEFSKLKFLDDRIKSYVRKELTEIFFDKNKNLIKPKDDSKIIAKFYEMLLKTPNLVVKETYADNKGNKKERNSINEKLLKELYERHIFTTKTTRKRDKNKVTYSLKIYAPKQANFIIRRNNGFEGLINKDIATANFIDNDTIKQISFHSKNVLPLKIANILNILNLSQNAHQIYAIKTPQNKLPSGILELAFIVSQKNRHDIKVSLSKEILKEFDLGSVTDEMKVPTKSDELTPLQKEFERFYDEILGDKFKNFLGKPQYKKVKILENSQEKLTLSYRADQTSMANREFFAKILNETSHHQ